MSYKTGNRIQHTFLPPAIEDYISPEDPVRVYDAFVDSLDFNLLGLSFEPQKGAESYCPKKMLKLIIYGISYGINSSRKLERACNHNLSFIWLLCGLKPDYRTIARFRRDNKQAIQKVLKQCVRMCIDFDLIDGNILFVDGSKIRANASIKNTWTKKKCNEMLNKIDQKIDALIEEGENIDEQEEQQQSLVKVRDDLKDQEKLKTKIKDILKELEMNDKKFLNTTDSDCANMRSTQGSHASYNVQNVVDEKHGLIVNTDVVNESNDINQFAVQIEQANEVLGRKCQVSCGDSGYANTTELEKIDTQDIKVIVPSQRQSLHKEEKPFSKSQFTYDKEHNRYICPEGQVLKYRGINTIKQHLSYTIKNPETCKQCKNYTTCTDSKFGRRIIRLTNEDTREKLEKQYDDPESQEIYKLRKQKAELPFGHYKHNLGFRQFLRRGKEHVKADASLLATCFNIVRMITIIGVNKLIFKLKCS
jgi:transposase